MLFVAGDFSTGPKDIISAVADAKQAAEAIDRFLAGTRRRESYLAVGVAEETGRLRDHDLMAPSLMPVLPLNERSANEEVELGHGDAGINENPAGRCRHICGQRSDAHGFSAQDFDLHVSLHHALSHCARPASAGQGTSGLFST